MVKRSCKIRLCCDFSRLRRPFHHIVTRAGNNNFHSKTTTANGLITCLLAFSLTPHVKSTRAHTLLHNVSLVYLLSYEYIAHSLLAITVLAFVRASYSNTTVIHFSTRILARAITLSISLQYGKLLDSFTFWFCFAR